MKPLLSLAEAWLSKYCYRTKNPRLVISGECQKDDPELFELFCDRALNDPFEHKHTAQENPRQAALAGLLRNYLNHPQTLLLLRDRAENDPDEQLREWAKKQLEKFDND